MQKTYTSINKFKTGFTLVELSIVLVIIGLLIGGILVGQNLLANADRLRVIRELQAFQHFYDKFEDIYRQKPGDMNNRVSLFGGASNGDGDGIIEWNGNEARYFWGDLDTAGLLENNVFSGGLPFYYRPFKGKVHNFTEPKYSAVANDALYAAQNDGGISGNSINLSATGDPNVGHINRTAILGSTVFAIDKKIDDGRPRSGFLRGNQGIEPNGSSAKNSPETICAQNVSGTIEYKVDTDDFNCRMHLMLDFN